MISDMKNKLAMLSKMQPQKEQTPVRHNTTLACSVFENSYDADYMIGNVKLDDFFDIDTMSLQKLCNVESYEKLDIEDILFFDTETTGLSSSTGTVAFLIGVGYIKDRVLYCEQYLMNDYHQELNMLEKMESTLLRHKAVVSYNGRSFDAPLLRTRFILNRLNRTLDDMLHLDLLHAARRLYKRRIGSCGLTDIEDKILEVQRIDDIEGAEIPEIFFSYIKYGDDSRMKTVIEHNNQDILSMCALSKQLCDAYNNPLNSEHREDILSQGIIFEKLGCQQKAKVCYNSISSDMDALLRLAYIYKREQNYIRAIDIFGQIARSQMFDIEADIQMAIIYEHRLKDIGKALEQTNIALMKIKNNIMTGDLSRMDEVIKRRDRIRLKIKIGMVKKCQQEGM